MSDHALICCAVRTRRGDSRDQRTEMGLVRKNSKAGENVFLKLENVSTVHHCPPGEEPCVWSDWGAKGCCWVRDQCGPQEGKACPGQKKIITKVNYS